MHVKETVASFVLFWMFWQGSCCSDIKYVEGKEMPNFYAQQVCIAECLELVNSTHAKSEASAESCKADIDAEERPETADSENNICEGVFVPSLRNKDKVVACSFDEHSVMSTFNSEPTVQLKLCTHIFFAAWFRYNSTTREIYAIQHVIQHHMETKKMASERGLKVILELGNPNEIYSMSAKAFSKVAMEPESRTDFIVKLLALVEKYQFDGLSLRWDKPGCPNEMCSLEYAMDKKNILLLAKELYPQLQKRGKIFVLLISNNERILRYGMDLLKLVDHVDYLYARTINYGGVWSNKVEYDTTVSDMYPFVNSMKSLLGPKMKKLLFSFSNSILKFQLTKPIPNPQVGSSARTDLSRSLYWDMACLTIKRGNYTIIENIKHQNMAHNTEEVIIYDGFASMKSKINLIMSAGAGGVMIIHVSRDDADDECECGAMPMLRTVAELTRGAGCLVKKCP